MVVLTTFLVINYAQVQLKKTIPQTATPSENQSDTLSSATKSNSNSEQSTSEEPVQDTNSLTHDQCLETQHPDWNSCLCTNQISTEELLARLTLEEKVQQTLVPAFTYYRLHDDDEETGLNKYGFGGYILIKSTKYRNPEQIQKDATKFQKKQLLPAFIGLDAEGGEVERLRWHEFKTLQELAEKKDQSLGKFCGEMLKDITVLQEAGFNWSVAPVADLPYSKSDWIYGRTAGTNKDTVIATVSNYLQCMEKSHIFTTVKHFPGHGGTTTDSHVKAPVIDHSKEQWEEEEGEVFKQTVSLAPSLMAGHLIYPDISDKEASLSATWLTDIVRGEMNYSGLIITDDIMMLHPEDTGECAKKILKSLEAGADMVIFAENAACLSEELPKKLSIRVEEKEKVDIIDARVKNIIEAKKRFFCK